MTPIPRRKFLRAPLVYGGLLGLAIWFAVWELPAGTDAQALPAPLSYTQAQAQQGQFAYVEHCASCHGQNLDDGAFAPPLKGVDFRQKWGSRSVEGLFSFTSTKMPPDRPGTLGDAVYAQLLAYMLRENGAQPGPRELPTDPEALKALAAPDWPRGDGEGLARADPYRLAPGVTLPPPPPGLNPLDKMRPVTDAMLIKPPEGEWLAWRRTYDAFGFSPLKQINRTNVNELRVAWSWALPNGPNESTPLVHDGVMFVHGYGDHVQALDAVTGDLLWQYESRRDHERASYVSQATAACS